MGLVRNNQNPPLSASHNISLPGPHVLHPILHYDPNNSACSICQLQSSGLMLTCKTCNLSLLHQACAEFHQACARLPRSLPHPSHAGSCGLPLSLAHCAYPGGKFICDGCRQTGERWGYHCAKCNYDLHERCAVRPQRIRHRAHASCELALIFKGPFPNSLGFVCDVCRQPGENDLWRYRCQNCDFDVHLDCVV
ncbi:cysteine/Histidine-rich C1 domain family protein [Striga asiatica]|uniref:Cysteine/Histidine-rich C1 domain family protein n=1 Tax=Striga asiatica TaxID=4170 RepID=A0A5A7R900_STRAF|nr:cysteine/Histidine-rich C1 domain family protein [Striga asiatica]